MPWVSLCNNGDECQVLSLDQTLDKLNAELRGLTQSASSNMNLVHEQIKKQIAK